MGQLKQTLPSTFEPSVKRLRFQRIANTRKERIIESIKSLSKCAEAASYAYTDEEVEEIFTAISEALEDAQKAFSGKSKFILATEDNEITFSGLKSALKMFKENSWRGSTTFGFWRIAQGGYSMWFQVYYKDELVLDCIEGELESNYGLTETEKAKLIEIVQSNLLSEAY